MTRRQDSPETLQPDAAGVARAAALLTAGELVAFPTETVYGLGGDATSDRAVAAIFAVKDRPRFNPLIVHLADTVAARAYAVFDARALALAERFWPGPLSLVLPRTPNSAISLLASAGLDTIALRVPGHDAARAMLAACATPIAAPSANRSGDISPTEPAHVRTSLGDGFAAVLDAGRCRIGLESTVVGLCGGAALLLRPGGLERAAIEAVIGPLGDAPADGPAASPGQLASHYAPRLALRLAAHEVRADEALLAFGPAPLSGAARTRNLSPDSDIIEAAANLFAMLRELDQPEFAGIAAMPIPETGLGEAINDRLRRAATG